MCLVRAIELAVFQIEADRKQPSLCVVKKREVHLERRLLDARRDAFQRSSKFAGGEGRSRKGPSATALPNPPRPRLRQNLPRKLERLQGARRTFIQRRERFPAFAPPFISFSSNAQRSRSSSAASGNGGGSVVSGASGDSPWRGDRAKPGEQRVEVVRQAFRPS